MRHFQSFIVACASLVAFVVAAPCAHAAQVSVSVSTVSQLNTAIANAEAAPSNNYVITLAGGTYYLTQSYLLTKAKIEIKGSVSNPGGYTLDAKNINHRLFTVKRAAGQSTYLWLTGVTLRNGRRDNDGGGCIFMDDGDLVLSNSVVDTCTAALAGAAIYAYGARVNLFQTVIKGAYNPFYQNGGGGAQGSGGGLYANGASTVEMTRATFTNNKTVRGGGFMIDGSSTLTMKNTTVSGNTAIRGGGAMIRGSGAIRMYFNTIYDNKAGLSGATEPRVGGGVLFSDYTGLLQFYGNIVAKNINTVPGSYATPGDDCFVENPTTYGRWNEVKYFTNVIGKLDDTCAFKLGHLMVWGIGGQNWAFDPQLGALTSNGTNYGSVVPTHLPLLGSPVRGAYHSAYGPGSVSTGVSCYSDDQRAKPRKSAPGQCDVGSVEATGN